MPDKQQLILAQLAAAGCFLWLPLFTLWPFTVFADLFASNCAINMQICWPAKRAKKEKQIKTVRVLGSQSVEKQLIKMH